VLFYSFVTPKLFIWKESDVRMASKFVLLRFSTDIACG